MSDKKQKWGVEEFVKILNDQAPLKERDGEDSRRTNEWNVRLLRHYATEKAISRPLKEGRKAYYTEEHLREIQLLLQSQSMGMSSKFYSSNSEKIRSSLDSYVRSNSSLLGGNGLIANSLSASSQLGFIDDELKKKKQNILSVLDSMNGGVVSSQFPTELKGKAPNTEDEYLWKHIKINDYLTIQIREDNIDKKDEIIKLLNNMR